MEIKQDSSFLITIDNSSGRILSLKGGQEFGAKNTTLPLFSLRFRDSVGDPSVVTSDELAYTGELNEESDTLAILSFDGTKAHQVSAQVHVKRGRNSAEFLWHIQVAHEREGFLEWIEFPGLCVTDELIGRGGDATLFSPVTEGVLVENIAQRQGTWLAYEPVEYPNHGWCGYYPGNAQMQFLALSRREGVLYFAAHDPAHSTKELEFCPEGEGIRLIVRVFPGAIAAGKYELPYPMVMALLPGDWQDAAARYRDWIQSGEVQMPPKLAQSGGQKWLEDSPIVVTYPITGEGHHAGPTKPNEFFPFVNAMPTIEKLGARFNSRILTLLMHWEGTAPWAPPYVWPPRGGEDGLRQFADQLHEKSHLLGVYCSGVAWTNTATTGDGGYDRTDELERQNLIQHMCRGPKGEYECKICNGEEIRYGYDICAATEFAREVISAEAAKIASVGVDYIQLFDQNLGGASYQCYDKAHGHPPAPGPWQPKAMNELISVVRSRLASEGHGNVIMGCEAAAAESFIGQLPLNDLRFHMGFAYGRPVPAYGFVFHEYTTNFMGNQVEGLVLIDHMKSPQNLMLRLAHSFCAGDLLTVVLKDGGEIQWSWCTPWSVDPPPQKPLLDFIEHLNSWRRGAGKPFLFFGRMEKTVPFDGPDIIPLHLNSERVNGILQYSAVLASRWTTQDRREAQFLVNYSDREQVVYLKTGRSCAILHDPFSAEVEKMSSSDGIRIPPLKAILVEMGPE